SISTAAAARASWRRRFSIEELPVDDPAAEVVLAGPGGTEQPTGASGTAASIETITLADIQVEDVADEDSDGAVTLDAGPATTVEAAEAIVVGAGGPAADDGKGEAAAEPGAGDGEGEFAVVPERLDGGDVAEGDAGGADAAMERSQGGVELNDGGGEAEELEYVARTPPRAAGAAAAATALRQSVSARHLARRTHPSSPSAGRRAAAAAATRGRQSSMPAVAGDGWASGAPEGLDEAAAAAGPFVVDRAAAVDGLVEAVAVTAGGFGQAAAGVACAIGVDGEDDAEDEEEEATEEDTALDAQLERLAELSRASAATLLAIEGKGAAASRAEARRAWRIRTALQQVRVAAEAALRASLEEEEDGDDEEEDG
ncbi:hypothetical protein HK405_001878, partial [Cladochytrium tenue]